MMKRSARNQRDPLRKLNVYPTILPPSSATQNEPGSFLSQKAYCGFGAVGVGWTKKPCLLSRSSIAVEKTAATSRRSSGLASLNARPNSYASTQSPPKNLVKSSPNISCRGHKPRTAFRLPSETPSPPPTSTLVKGVGRERSNSRKGVLVTSNNPRTLSPTRGRGRLSSFPCHRVPDQGRCSE